MKILDLILLAKPGLVEMAGAGARRQGKEERKNQELDGWISQKSNRTEVSRQRKEKVAE